MEAETLFAQLSPYLFWDMDLTTLDVERHSQQLIQRVLEYGTLNDWRLTRNYYGLQRIVRECKNMRTLDAKALCFICAISDTDKNDYRCYHFRQSNPTRWNF